MFGIDKDFQNLMEQLYGPLNKDKEPPDTIEIGGVKYKRIEEPQSFYDKLWGLLSTKISNNVYECDDMADKVRDLIREHIPKPKKGLGLPEYYVGYNDAIQAVNLRLFNGIQ
jgi:hypothetical protein